MMISPHLSLVTPASSAVLVAPLVRARRPRGTVSSHKESIKPEMTPKSGQNARCGVVAFAAAASGDGNNNNNNANENPPSTSTSNASSAAAAAAAAAIAAAASAAVDEFIRSGDVVAVGPGELPAAVLCELARRLESGSLEKVRVVAAGDAPAAEAAVAGVPQVQQSEEATTPDVAILQADEVDRGDLSFIACRHDDGLLGTCSSSPSSSSSGRGGSLPQPHLARVAAAASAARRGTVALAASPLSLVERLTGDVPVAVELEEMPDGSGRDWEEAAEELDDEFLGDAALGVWRRPSASGLPRTHPRGGDNPHAEVTVEGGTTLLDVRFGDGGPLALLGDARAAYEDVLATIEGVDGVVGCGLFCRGVAGVVVVAGGDDGKSPRVMRRPT